jgi:hypothetical protein
MRTLALRGAFLCGALLGCGSDLPSRYVLEHDAGDFAYRRYQRVLDVEVPVPGNPASGYTATYLRRGVQSAVAIATAFVTVYDRAPSLSAEVHERLAKLARYRISVVELGGGNVWLLDGGPNERWAAWVSSRYLVKLGAPAGQEFPDTLVGAYMDLYPSDLDDHGRARDDAPSRGESQQDRQEAQAAEPQIPHSLRENAPR